jgi:tetratricopeptide (TPR) repeat protein
MAKPITKSNSGRKAASAPKGNQQLLPYLVAAILAALTWFAFQPGLANNFVDWDDLKYITENGCIQLKGRDLFHKLFFGECKFIMGNYHPVTILSLAWNYQSGQFNPEVYHKTNLIFHVLNTLLLYVLVMRLSSGKIFVAAVAAALFALHPQHVESVTWAAERKDVLYTFFLLLAWNSFQMLKDKEQGIRIFLVSVFFILSGLSKGMAVVLPLLMLLGLGLSDESVKQFIKKQTLRSWLQPDVLKSILQHPRFIEFTWYFVLSILFGYMAVLSQDTQGGIKSYPEYGGLHKIMLACYGFVHYLWKMVYPEGLSAIYPYPKIIEGALPLKFTIAPIVVVALGLLTWLSTRFTRGILFAMLGYLLCILPVLQILPVGEAIACDRYFYVSSIPLFIGIAWAVQSVWIQNHKSRLAIAGVLFLGINIVLLLLTREQTKVWFNDLSLFNHAVTHEPMASQAQNNVGIYWQRQKEVEKAIPFYEEAVRLNPTYARAYSNMGAAYYDLKQYQASVNIYRKAITSDPVFADAWYNLGNSWYMLTRFDIAEKYYAHAISLNPYYYAAFYNRAVCKGAQGRHSEALEDYITAAKGGHPQAQEALNRSGVNWNNRAAVPSLPGKK